MDTNLITSLLTALADQKASIAALAEGKAAAEGFGLQRTLLWIAAAAPTLLAIAVYFKSKAAEISARQAEKNTESTKATVEKVEKAQNGEKEQMKTEMASLRNTVLSLTKEKSANEERQRGHETNAAVAAGPLAQQGTDLSPSALAQILQAIKESKG